MYTKKAKERARLPHRRTKEIKETGQAKGRQGVERNILLDRKIQRYMTGTGRVDRYSMPGSF